MINSIFEYQAFDEYNAEHFSFLRVSFEAQPLLKTTLTPLSLLAMYRADLYRHTFKLDTRGIIENTIQLFVVIGLQGRSQELEMGGAKLLGEGSGSR